MGSRLPIKSVKSALISGKVLIFWLLSVVRFGFVQASRMDRNKKATLADGSISRLNFQTKDNFQTKNTVTAAALGLRYILLVSFRHTGGTKPEYKANTNG